MSPNLPANSEDAQEEVSASKIKQMAQQVMGILQEQLEWLKKGEEGEGAILSYSESRTKMALVISKGIQTLEDLYNRMVKNEADQCPPSTLEVRSKLEKQIAILANTEPKTGGA